MSVDFMIVYEENDDRFTSVKLTENIDFWGGKSYPPLN
jgi:hypothetical protein